MTMKKKLLTTLSVVLILGLAALGILAYLTDTTPVAKNVMTTGKVDIVQHEYDVNGNEITDGKFGDLYPGTEVVKKVNVENIGESPAYVRTLVAFETIDSNTFDYTPVWGPSVNAKKVATIVVDDVKYDVYEVVYENALAKGKATANSLEEVQLGKDSTNEDMELLGGTYEVLVLSQAVQVEGFADAQTALDTAFPKGNNNANVAKWFDGMIAFVGGKGTADDPYLIDEPSQLMNISNYDEYTYFKVADGVETLDMTGVGKIKLNGSFDGNGVTMNNLSTALFQSVGEVGDAQEIKISNFTANVHTTDGSALVKNIYNPGNTIFENVTLHGYIEGQYNVGSFYNYGTANGDSIGADYTVSFVNTKSDATLVCTSGNAIGGMLGHGYEGAGNTLYINMDADSSYTGQMYTTGTAKCYRVMALCSEKKYKLNGVETNYQNDEYPSTRLTKNTPTAGADGYYVAPATDVDHYVVYLNSQLTAYDANGAEIANKAGMTWNLGKKTITSGFDGKIFDLITSAKIVNNAGDELGYAMNNGELTIYSGRADNYASGWVTLQVNQYDEEGNLLATGITTVYTFPEL